MSEYATALKFGTTYLVLSILELGWRPATALRNPVQAIKEISRDPTHRWMAETDARGSIGAIDLQRGYLSAAKDMLAGRGPDTDWTLREWESTLDGLEKDPLGGRTQHLDWAAKRAILADYIDSEGLRWDDGTLPSFDLAYSSIDPEESLYYALEQAGQMVRVTTESDIEQARTEAPENTRAAIRGALVERFAENIGAAGWNRVIMRAGSESWMADLDEYLSPEEVRPALARVRAATNLEQLLSAFPEGAKIASCQLNRSV